ncbi:Oidioi.mRNA.OKI2018_I69.chr1.g2499.t1.cds [Oikopleura dioica]|uniref:Oidioi.mRNA.OKI2018_I69.chr1.g2499.t1.cds n=1 Tax=Oikopleura dioica TaxID=34765 RepID=A0ABN7SXN2_OIKDI|nr:Oidioi.mRNA.OKI2018_I69.chr1.g2499.t1.cds [Oikopleura dioica]
MNLNDRVSSQMNINRYFYTLPGSLQSEVLSRDQFLERYASKCISTTRNLIVILTLSKCKVIACPYNDDEESCLCVCQQCHLERCQCSCSMVLPSSSPAPSVSQEQDQPMEGQSQKKDQTLEDVTVQPLVRSKKTFPNENGSNSSVMGSKIHLYIRRNPFSSLYSQT